MSRIWKYVVEPNCSALLVPRGAKPLSAQLQHGEVVVWFLVDDATAGERIERRVVIVGTGHDFDASGLTFVGTVQVARGEIIVHVFVD